MNAGQIDILVQIRSQVAELQKTVAGLRDVRTAIEATRQPVMALSQATSMLDVRLGELARRAVVVRGLRASLQQTASELPTGFFSKGASSLASATSGGSVLGQIPGFGALAGGGGLAVAATAIGAVTAAAAAGTVAGMKYNAMMEQQEVAFGTLLKSADAARQRMADLTQFAASTPFELPEVVQASRVLQALTGDALATGHGLRLVGDAAAGVGQPFQDVAMWVGRLYAGLDSGTPVGEATMRLVEMGAISGEQARALNALAESGKGVGKAFEELTGVFGRFDGAMDKQSRTLNGLMSTLKDTGMSVLGELTSGLTRATKEALESILSASGSIEDKAVVEARTRLRQRLTERDAAKAKAEAPGLAAAAEEATRRKAEEDFAMFRTLLWSEARAKIAAEDLRTGVSTAKADLDAKKLTLEEYAAIRRGQIADEMQLEIEAARRAAAEKARETAGEKDPAKRLSERQQIEIVEAAIAVARSRAKGQEQALEMDIAQLTAKQAADAEREAQAAERAADAAERKTEAARREAQHAQEQLLAERRQGLGDDMQGIQGDWRTPRAQQFQNARSRMLSGLEDGSVSDGEYGAFATQQGPDPTSFSEQWTATLTSLQDQWGSFAQQTAAAFESVFNSAIGSISNGITGLIMGTQTWGQALASIGTSILTSVIGAIVQMGVRWIATQILMATVGKGIMAASVAASTPIAVAQSAVWATPATLATIASYGGAASAAPGFIAMAQGITMAQSLAAFAEGGLTPGTRTLAWVGERGPELVLPAEATARFNPQQQAMLMDGRMPAIPVPVGGDSAAGGETRPINIHNYVDKQAWLDAMRDEIEGIAVNAMRRAG